jgi:hypothetical protein
LKPRNIIYFEDPFGKTRYYPNKELERQIAKIVETIQHFEDVYVIITSRNDVLSEFKPIAEIDISKLEIRLNIDTPSYDYKKRKEMLLKHAELRNCKWLNDPDLRNAVLEYLKVETKLPTPLNIEDFALASKEITKLDELSKVIEAKSKETERAFAEEIRIMSTDKIVFLSFPFISDFLSLEFGKHMYQEIVNELWTEKEGKNAQRFDTFEDILKRFKDNRIQIGNVKGTYTEFKNIIRFSHPSYFEAMKYVLSENGTPTKAGDILSSVLLKLVGYDSLIRDIANTIASNYDKVPENVKDLLFKLADRKDAASDVASSIASNCDRLPEHVVALLLKLAGNKDVAHEISWTVKDNFDKLGYDVRNELLLKLASNKDAAYQVGWTLHDNFDKLGYDVRNELLLKLASKKHGGAEHVSETVASNYDKVPENVKDLLFKLADRKDAAWSVAHAVADNFDKLPPDFQNILFKLADTDDMKVASDVAYGLEGTGDALPANVRHELLRRIQKASIKPNRYNLFIIIKNFFCHGH